MDSKVKRRLEGVVSSVASDKTITVIIETKKPHKVTGKYIKRTKKLMVHDEQNLAQLGDFVSIEETRPYSKRKMFKLVDVVIKKEMGE